ncbi:MAG: VIT1/CCC1 transporter family protein [Candidatus Krumholzibacteriia bacterium]
MRLARLTGSARNREVLERIAADELRHADVARAERLQRAPRLAARARVRAPDAPARYSASSCSNGRRLARQVDYDLLVPQPEAREVLTDEADHEKVLFEMLDDAVLANVGSIVLGLNDALVELTGTLAGLSFAFQSTKLVALSGLVTGIAAAFSMAASEYLSQRADGLGSARRSALYTGLAYIVTVALLVGPYLVFADYRVCLAVTLVIAVLVILLFTAYLAVARGLDFRRRFLEMAGISLGVAAFSFVVGVVVKRLLGVDV